MSAPAAPLQPAGPAAPPTSSALWRWYTRLVAIPLIAISTVICGTLSFLCSLWDKDGHQQHAMARFWARTLLRIALSPVEIVHPENLPTSGGAVYACNHLSYMDTPALFGTLPFQFRILANHYLFRVPFMGWHLTRSGQVPIDQASMRTQIAGLTRGVKTLKSGMPILIFPDGGRAPDGHVHQFLSGAAFMAIRAQVPLVPMALVGTYEVLPMHVYHLTPRPVKLAIGAPIDTTGMTTREVDALTNRLLDAISTMYYAHSPLQRPEVAPPNLAKTSDEPARV